MRPATPQDPAHRALSTRWNRGIPWIARLAAWAAVLNTIGLVGTVLLLARPCGAQEGDGDGPVIVAAERVPSAEEPGRPILPAPAGKPAESFEIPGPILPQSVPLRAPDVAAGPPSAAPPAPAGRAALDRAALRALAEPLADRRARREYAGVIYRTAAGVGSESARNRSRSYGFTAPQRARREGGFELRLRPGVDYPRGAEVVAIYHTHPRAAGRRGDAHSPHDVEVARELGVVSYLGVVRTGAVHRYDPHARPHAPAGYPRGAHVGARVEVEVGGR